MTEEHETWLEAAHKKAEASLRAAGVTGEIRHTQQYDIVRNVAWYGWTDGKKAVKEGWDFNTNRRYDETPESDADGEEEC